MTDSTIPPTPEPVPTPCPTCGACPTCGQRPPLAQPLTANPQPPWGIFDIPMNSQNATWIGGTRI